MTARGGEVDLHGLPRQHAVNMVRIVISWVREVGAMVGLFVLGAGLAGRRHRARGSGGSRAGQA